MRIIIVCIIGVLFGVYASGVQAIAPPAQGARFDMPKESSPQSPQKSSSSRLGDPDEIAAMIGHKIVDYLLRSCTSHGYRMLPAFRSDWALAIKTGDPVATFRAQSVIERCMTQTLNGMGVFGVILTLPPLPPLPPEE